MSRSRHRPDHRVRGAKYSRISVARVRVLLDRALDGRMDAVQELMESDPVNSVLERYGTEPRRLRDLQQLCEDAAAHWAGQTRYAKTRHTPMIAAYAHYLRWMSWTLHPIEEDDL